MLPETESEHSHIQWHSILLFDHITKWAYRVRWYRFDILCWNSKTLPNRNHQQQQPVFIQSLSLICDNFNLQELFGCCGLYHIIRRFHYRKVFLYHNIICNLSLWSLHSEQMESSSCLLRAPRNHSFSNPADKSARFT